MHITPNLTSVFKVRSTESAELIPSHWFRSVNSDAFTLQHATELIHFIHSFLYDVLIVRLPSILSDPLPTSWTRLCLMHIRNTNMYHHPHLNGHFPGEYGLASYPSGAVHILYNVQQGGRGGCLFGSLLCALYGGRG